MLQAASVLLTACCLGAWVLSRAEPPAPPAPSAQGEPHLFELLDAPPPRGAGGGGARRQTIDYFFYYPREMPASRGKRQSVQLLQQAMYKTRARLRALAGVVAPHCAHRAYRMAVLHGRVEALERDLHAVWSMAANNELAVAYGVERLVYLYAHALRKYLDLTYIVEYLLLLHHRNVKYVYGVKARVDRLNAGGGTTGPPGGDRPTTPDDDGDGPTAPATTSTASAGIEEGTAGDGGGGDGGIP